MPARKKNKPIDTDQLPEEIQVIDAMTDRLEKYLSDRSKSFFIDTLKELAIPYPLVEFQCQRDKKPSSGYYMCPDKDGNIRFYTPDASGNIEVYSTEGANVKVHEWYLTRFQFPTTAKDGSLAKYMPVTGGGTRLLITPKIVENYKAKKQIETLYMVEGFKKAHAMAFHGNLPVIGMNGLSGFKEPDKDKIRVELKEIIMVCQVKKVVIVYDSDLFDISSSKDKAETVRPNLFFSAALAAKKYIENLCDVVLVHPKPGDKKLGFDDLLLEKRETEFTTSDLFRKTIKPDKGHQSVFDDFEKTLADNSGSMFSMIHLSASRDYKIREYFHLKDVNDFYNYHIDILREKGKFQFYTFKYKINESGVPEEIKETEDFGYITKNGFVYKRSNNPEKEDTLISNFTWEILFHIKGDESTRVIKLKNNENETATIEANGDDLNSPQRFSAICINSGRFMFYGGKDDLLKMTGILLRHERSAVVFSFLGYQPYYDVFAFSNGIATIDGWKPCNDDGIVEHNDQYFYFPAFSKFNEDKKERFADERKYIHIPGSKNYTFEQWKERFVKCYGDNGEVTVCFYLASLFSDIIFNHKSGIRFPLLFASGKPRTGKSTIMISLLYLFGEGLIGESLTSNSTFKFLFTQLAKVRNGLVFFDEFKGDIPKIYDFLKNIFDRRPYGTKQYSNDTKTRITPVLSAVCCCGETLPTGNHAFFTRTISMMFNRSIDQRTNEEKENLRLLSSMESNGLTNITVYITKHRAIIEKNFDLLIDSVESELERASDGVQIDGRIKKSAIGILTVVKIMIDEKVIDYGTPWPKLLQIWVRVLSAQTQQIQTNTDAAKFWEVIEMLVREGKISQEAGDFKIEDDYLILRLNRLVLPYQKKAYELHFDKVLDKASLKNYLENEPYFVEMLTASGDHRQTRFNGSTSPIEGLWIDYEQLRRLFNCDLSSIRHSEWEPLPTPKPEEKKPTEPFDPQKDLPF